MGNNNGINWDQQYAGLDMNQISPYMKNPMLGLQTGKGAVKDKMFGLVAADYNRALNAQPLYSQNTIANQAKDMRTEALSGWMQTQKGIEDAGNAAGRVDMGAFNQQMGQAQGQMENQLRSNVANMVSQANQANEQDRQQLMAKAMNEIQQYLMMKKQKRQARQQYADAMSEMNANSGGSGWQQALGLGMQLAPMFI